MLKTILSAACFLIPGSSIVLAFVLLRKLYISYVHTKMEEESSLLSAPAGLRSVENEREGLQS